MSPVVLQVDLFYAFLAYCFYRILSRVGYTPWAALLVFVPFVGQAVLIVWLAFGRWPLFDQLEAWLRRPIDEDDYVV